MKKTLQEKLAARKLHKPPFLLYLLLALVVKALFLKKLRVTFHYKLNKKDFPSQYIVVSNHASRLDYIYVTLAFLPHTLNYVAGYNEFFRSHLRLIFHLMQVIPKKNFVADSYTIREIRRIIQEGGRIALFPEGMSSISGANQPCAVASGKLLKHFMLPVLRLKIAGGYLTSTKYCLDERPGKVEVEVSSLFTPDDLAKMTADQIQLALDKALTHDDYEWNKTARVPFAGNNRMAENLHTMLYFCPKCGAEFVMRGSGNVISCGKCGNGASLNEYYDLAPLDDSCVIPNTPRLWFDLQRKKARECISSGGFELRERVKLGTLPHYALLRNQATSEITGGGELVLNCQGLHFSGSRRLNGAKESTPFSFSIKPEQLPTYGMCTDLTRFYTFHNNEFLEFFPENQTVAKWLLATEENHRAAGGAWKDFPWKNRA